MCSLQPSLRNSETSNYHKFMSHPDLWLQRLNQIIYDQIQEDISNEDLARSMCISERQLFRKLKELTNMSPRNYIRQLRLKKAMQYLQNGDYKTVGEVTHAIGYTNVSYFITQFERVFGKKPLQILKEKGWR